MDYNFITSRVATGAALSSEQDVQTLIDAGITHVVDCRAEYDDASLFKAYPQIMYLWNGVNDDGQPKPPSWFNKSIVFALNGLSLPKTRLYCHCAAGVNRGPSTAYVCLRAAIGLDPATTEAMIRKARPQVGLAYKKDADNAIQILGYD